MGVRRTGDEHRGLQVYRKRRHHAEVRDRVERSVVRDGLFATQQLLNDPRVLHEAGVTLFVRGRVVQRLHVVPEAVGHHVQVRSAAIHEAERRDRLGHGVGVGISRLHGDDRAQLVRGADDRARHEPGIELPVVGGNQNTFAPRLFAPTRHVLDVTYAGARLVRGCLWAGGKDLQVCTGTHHGGSRRRTGGSLPFR